MTQVVLPGDLVLSEEGPSRISHKIIGHGLEKRSDGIFASISGILNQTDNKIWIASSNTRYIPSPGDKVLGVVSGRFGDYFRVDVGANDLALLNFTSFEGATKRNRPSVKMGDLIYGVISVASRNADPEISCVDAEGKARGFGVIGVAGLLFSVSLNYARRLLSVNDRLMKMLSESEIKFEVIIGMNGRILMSGGINEVLAVKEAILKSEKLFEENFLLIIKNVALKYQINLNKVDVRM